MLYLTLAILGFLALQGYKREKSIINFQTLFCLLWCVVCYAASLHLYDMMHFPDSVYIVFLVGCIGFSIGCNLYSPQQKRCSFSNRYALNKKLLNTIYYTVAIFMIYFTIKTIMLLKSGIPYSEIRSMWGLTSHEDAMMTNKFEIFVQQFILIPVIPILNCLLLLKILRIIDLKKEDIIKVLILSVLYVFVSGSRIVITNLLVQGFLFVSLFKIRLTVKYIKKIVISVLLLVVLISIISENRERERVRVEWDASKTYYAYCALPVPMCYYHMERADRMNYRSYGLSFFKGMATLSSFPLSFLDIPRPEAFINMDEFYQGVHESVQIFYGIEHNAYVSMFFYFFLDFGLFGVFLGSFIYAVFLNWLYRKALRDFNLRNILLLLIALISFAKCFAKWEFQGSDYIMSFVLVYLLTYRKTLKNSRLIVQRNLYIKENLKD